MDHDVAADIVEISDSTRALSQLRGLIDDKHIVLLGENGHGVGPHTSWKVLFTRFLLDSLGFTTVIFESGYHECGEADEVLTTVSPVRTLRDCLAYVFEHAEALPLFEYLRAARERGSSVHIAGADLQPQGPVSQSRPTRLRRALQDVDSALARAVQAADSGLLAASQLGGDSLRSWLQHHGASARESFNRAARIITPGERWRVHAALGLLRRGELRFPAGGSDGPASAAYYAARDLFMARTVSWIADSLGEARRVVVWMHNDHVRLGRLASPGGSVPVLDGCSLGSTPATSCLSASSWGRVR